jgi:hypothetical protein
MMKRRDFSLTAASLGLLPFAVTGVHAQPRVPKAGVSTGARLPSTM